MASDSMDNAELTDHFQMVQLTEEMISGSSGSRTTALVTSLVHYITQSWRNHFAKSTTMKFNCFFFVPFMDSFPAYLRNELDALYDGSSDRFAALFDVQETRRALQARRQDLLAECAANSKLQKRFDQISQQLRTSGAPSPMGGSGSSNDNDNDEDMDMGMDMSGMGGMYIDDSRQTSNNMNYNNLEGDSIPQYSDGNSNTMMDDDAYESQSSFDDDMYSPNSYPSVQSSGTQSGTNGNGQAEMDEFLNRLNSGSPVTEATGSSPQERFLPTKAFSGARNRRGPPKTSSSQKRRGSGASASSSSASRNNRKLQE